MTWSRTDEIAVITLGVAVLALVAAWLVVPEFRRLIGLDKAEVHKRQRWQRRWSSVLVAIAGLLICGGVYWMNGWLGKPDAEQVKDKTQSGDSPSASHGVTVQSTSSQEVQAGASMRPAQKQAKTKAVRTLSQPKQEAKAIVPEPSQPIPAAQSEATSIPCGPDLPAIDMEARGHFEDLTINGGPCDKAIKMRPGSDDSTFKRAEINRNGKPQEIKQAEPAKPAKPNPPQSLSVPSFDPNLKKVSMEEAEVLVQEVVYKYTVPHHGEWPTQDWINQELKAEGFAIFVDQYYPPAAPTTSSTDAPKKDALGKPECSVYVSASDTSRASEIQQAAITLVGKYAERHGHCPNNDWLNGRLTSMGYHVFANVNCEARSIGIRVSSPNVHIKGVDMDITPCTAGIVLLKGGDDTTFANTKISVTVTGPGSMHADSAMSGEPPQ